MNLQIHTNRFILREILESDVEGIFKLDSNPDIHEFLGKNPITTREQAKEVIAHVRSQYQKNGMGRLAIIDKNTNEFIGWTGIKFEEKVREFSYYDLGYRLRKEFWGQGIATETAIASLKYGFEILNLKEIGGAADVDHIVSNKILQKVGLKFVETFEFEGDLCNWYNLKKEDWLKIK